MPLRRPQPATATARLKHKSATARYSCTLQAGERRVNAGSTRCEQAVIPVADTPFFDVRSAGNKEPLGAGPELGVAALSHCCLFIYSGRGVWVAPVDQQRDSRTGANELRCSGVGP